jgi:hypothetical protein
LKLWRSSFQTCYSYLQKQEEFSFLTHKIFQDQHFHQAPFFLNLCTKFLGSNDVETLPTIIINSLLSKLTSSTNMSNVLKSMVEASSARELSHSKLLTKLKFWFKEDQHQQDIIVQQILMFVDGELCKVKRLKGVA